MQGQGKFYEKNEGKYFKRRKKGGGAMKLPALIAIQAMKLPVLPTPPPQNQTMLMSMALVYLLSLPLVLCIFLHITVSSLKLKKLSMKNRINLQNDFMSLKDL